MKKNSKKIALILVLTIIGIVSIITGTFSKYFTKVTGDGKLEVAKWHFDVNGSTNTIATINLTDTYDEDTLVNGKIAPGTSGNFDLVLNAGDSEVGIDYEVTFSNEKDKPTNLVIKCDNKELSSPTFKGTIKPSDSRTVTLPIEWEWKYETGTGTEIASNDQIDTTDGLAAKDYTFDILITGTQVEPQK